MEETTKRIREMITELLPHFVPENDEWLNDPFELIGLNSFQYVQLIVNIEEEYEIVMDEVLADDYFTSVMELCDMILEKRGA
ncbi:MAG: acyl carrier protein [Lachnospiraceae bacterium]|nr:acyl carrier protein [Lachnospiraceae bacterium]